MTMRSGAQSPRYKIKILSLLFPNGDPNRNAMSCFVGVILYPCFLFNRGSDFISMLCICICISLIKLLFSLNAAACNLHA